MRPVGGDDTSTETSWAWPVAAMSLVWAVVAVLIGLPLTGGGHGPLVGIVVSVLAPLVAPLGGLSVSKRLPRLLRGGALAGLLLYFVVADTIIAGSLVVGAGGLLTGSWNSLTRLVIWLVLWFGGQAVLAVVLRRVLRSRPPA